MELYCSCQCSDFNHTIRFNLDEDDGDIWLETRLNAYEPWWKRIWIGIKYVFGRPPVYGHYDCTLLRAEDYDTLMRMFSRSSVIKLRNSLSGQPVLHLVGQQNNQTTKDEE